MTAEEIEMTDAAGFVALDVETANNWKAICSIGIATFSNDGLVDTWESLVDPECEFESRIVSIHGIDEDTVLGAPNFVEVMLQIHPLIERRIVVAHNSPFDRSAMQGEAARWGAPMPHCRWLDTVTVARRTWPGLPNHKLPTVCKHIGHSFDHHDALDDAKAAGHVLLAAMKETGKGLEFMARLAPG